MGRTHAPYKIAGKDGGGFSTKEAYSAESDRQDLEASLSCCRKRTFGSHS